MFGKLVEAFTGKKQKRMLELEQLTNSDEGRFSDAIELIKLYYEAADVPIFHACLVIVEKDNPYIHELKRDLIEHGKIQPGIKYSGLIEAVELYLEYCSPPDLIILDAKFADFRDEVARMVELKGNPPVKVVRLDLPM